MQRLRILLASVLLTITGVAVFGVKAAATPPTSLNPIPPQACSTGGTGNTSGVAVASLGYTGNSGFGSSGGGSGTGGGSGGN